MKRHNYLPAMLTLSLLALLSSGAVAAAAEVVSVAVPVGPYQISEAQGGQDLQVEGFGLVLLAGVSRTVLSQSRAKLQQYNNHK